MKGAKKFLRLFCAVIIMIFVAGNQVVNVMAAGQVLKVDRTISSTSVNLYDTGTLTYSLSSDNINYGSPNKEIVLAIDTTQTMEYKVDENEIVDDARAFDYTMFTGNTYWYSDQYSCMFINASGTEINGNIHSNNFIRMVSNTQVYGSAEAVRNIDLGWNCNIIPQQNKLINGVDGAVVPVIRLPSITSAILAEASNGGIVYSTDREFNGTSVTLDRPIFVHGSVVINSGSYNGTGFIAATGNIDFNAPSINQSGSLCVYSANGDIKVSVGSSNFKGIIYAPNGTVEINNSSSAINGRIIAKNIIINTGAVTVNDWVDYNVKSKLIEYMETTTRLDKVKQAAKSFIDRYSGNEQVRIGIVSYSDRARVVSGLIPLGDPANVDYLKARIDSLEPSDLIYTSYYGSNPRARRNTGDAMRRAYYMLKNSIDTNALKHMVVITDGIANTYTRISPTDNSYEEDDGNAAYVSWESNTGGGNYAERIGSMIRNDSYTTYFVALAGINYIAEDQLEGIALSSGAGIVNGAERFYAAATESNIDSAFSDIASKMPLPLVTPSELLFQSATFTQTFPEGIKVLSATDSVNSFSITKVGEQYTVTGNLSGLKLVKDSTTGYHSLASVPDIVVKVRYTSLSGTIAQLPGNISSSDTTINGAVINFKDHSGADGTAVTPSTNINIKFFIDIS